MTAEPTSLKKSICRKTLWYTRTTGVSLPPSQSTLNVQLSAKCRHHLHPAARRRFFQAVRRLTSDSTYYITMEGRVGTAGSGRSQASPRQPPTITAADV